MIEICDVKFETLAVNSCYEWSYFGSSLAGGVLVARLLGAEDRGAVGCDNLLAALYCWDCCDGAE